MKNDVTTCKYLCTFTRRLIVIYKHFGDYRMRSASELPTHYSRNKLVRVMTTSNCLNVDDSDVVIQQCICELWWIGRTDVNTEPLSSVCITHKCTEKYTSAFNNCDIEIYNDYVCCLNIYNRVHTLFELLDGIHLDNMTKRNIIKI